ncbi:MAG: hypothetical protein IKS90_08225 [Clostridia bacterium]|nr:hypothetical protein [Clostridia bacterium]
MSGDQKRKSGGLLNIFIGFIFFLFMRLDSWVISLPAWLTLILHFTTGLSLKWFLLTLIVWLVVGALRFVIIMFARWGASSSDSVKKESKNPYSIKKTDRSGERDGE